MKMRNKGGDAKVEMQMTAMIDVVFQLLIFFMLSFKIAAQEGDFQIQMPLGVTQGNAIVDIVPPIKVRMKADANGNLASISLNQDNFGTNFALLRNKVIEITGNELGPGTVRDQAEVEFDCDYDLQYAAIIQGITAVSGYRANDDQIIRLIEKIKFSPPRVSDSIKGDKPAA